MAIVSCHESSRYDGLLVKSLLDGKGVFLCVLLIGFLAMAARNAVDPDLWWHLKTGQYIAEHKGVPHVDPFSYTRSGAPWVAHEWLTELLLYQLERISGFAGLIVLFASIISAAFVLLYLRCGTNPSVAGVATLVAAWATASLWGVRPQMLSLLLTSLWLLLLEESERRPRLLWWTIPLTLLWVNLHAGFAVGLALSALFLAGECFEAVWLQLSRGLPQPNSSQLRHAAFILVLDLLMVPLNPNGLRLFSYPIETLRSAAMQGYIVEWASPNFHHAEYLPFLLLVLGTFAVLSLRWVRVRPRDLLLLLTGLYAGLVSIRMLPLFALIAAPVLSKGLGQWRLRSRPDLVMRIRQSLPSSHFLINAVIVLGMAGFAAVHLAQVIQRQPEAEARQFPERAVAYLRDHPASGAIFNDYDWGGYLIWKLYPSTQVFIDGRADLYGEEFLDQYADTYQLKGDWRHPLERWHIHTVLVPCDSALAVGLGNVPNWSVAYQDSQAVILTDQVSPR